MRVFKLWTILYNCQQLVITRPSYIVTVTVDNVDENFTLVLDSNAYLFYEYVSMAGLGLEGAGLGLVTAGLDYNTD